MISSNGMVKNKIKFLGERLLILEPKKKAYIKISQI